MARAASSIGREAWFEKTNGMPSAAAARATATSASRCAISRTPIGQRTNGLGSARAETSVAVSRTETSRSIRGTMRQRSNAARFSRIVSSVPAPPAT